MQAFLSPLAWLYDSRFNNKERMALLWLDIAYQAKSASVWGANLFPIAPFQAELTAVNDAYEWE